MKIKGKLLSRNLIWSFVLFSLSIGYISYNFKKVLRKNTEKIIEKEARLYANSFKARLDVNVNIARNLATFFEDYKMIPYSLRVELFRSVQKNLLVKNTQVLSVSTSWEYNKFDTILIGRTGRFLEGYHRTNGKIRSIDQQYEVDTTSHYHFSKETKTEILRPHRENYSQREGDEVFVANVSIPILSDDTFVGLVSIDVALEEFIQQVEKISPLPQSHAFLLSNKGEFITEADSSIVYKRLDNFFQSANIAKQVQEQVSKGVATSLRYVDKNNVEFYGFIAPIHLYGLEKPWAIGIIVPVDVVVEEANFNFYMSLLIGLASLMFLAIATWYYSKRIIDPLNDTILTLQAIAKGNISSVDPLEVDSEDEIGKIRLAVNTLLTALKGTAVFAQQIGQGNFEVEYKRLGKSDLLGNALLEMRENLRLREEEDNNRVIEELKLNWTTEGLAKFGDILRNEQGDLNELAYKLISNLIKHLRASQGGFYYLNPNEEGDKPFVEMLASFAFDDEKVKKSNFELGEGVVGEVVRENKLVYMDNIPNSYLNVVSGLGKANPRELLIVPVSNENGVFGAVELSSFIKFEDFQINFIEKLCSSIAGTFETSLANSRTKRLLKESGEQKEQLEMHELQLMENIKKLESVQLDTAKREVELKSVLSALHNMMPVAEYDMDGMIIYANAILLELLNIKELDLIGKKQGTMRSENGRETFENFWSDLLSGETKVDEQYYKFKERELWLSEVYTPILDAAGKPYKVLNIATDITARKLLERKLDNQE